MKQSIKIILLSLCMALVSCKMSEHGHEDSHGHDHHGHGHDEHEEEKGPHGGKMLEKGYVDLEVSIFETDVPPQFRLYPKFKGEPLAPERITAKVTLKRLGEEPEVFEFTPMSDFLYSPKVVREPHSFDVSVDVQFGERTFAWKYSSHEGRVQMPDEVVKASGIEVETAGSRVISNKVRLRGIVEPSEHKIAHIVPRFPGVVREGRKHIGDPVEKGEVLAVIESNQSLQPYEVRSQIKGRVVTGHLIVGEYVPEDQIIFVIADTSEVWVDLQVPVKEKSQVKEGQSVEILSEGRTEAIHGTISYLSPLAEEHSQMRLARVILKNPDQQLLPGTFVTGDVVVESREVPVAVKSSSLQTFRDWTVVFQRVGDEFEVRPVELGVEDGGWVEVKEGLKPQSQYASTNSFIVKADILKSGAGHDH